MAWEVAFPVKNELGEGPVFDTVTGCCSGAILSAAQC